MSQFCVSLHINMAHWMAEREAFKVFIVTIWVNFQSYYSDRAVWSRESFSQLADQISPSRRSVALDNWVNRGAAGFWSASFCGWNECRLAWKTLTFASWVIPIYLALLCNWLVEHTLSRGVAKTRGSAFAYHSVGWQRKNSFPSHFGGWSFTAPGARILY